MRSENTSELAQDKKSSKWLRPIKTYGLILDRDGLEKLEHLKNFGEEIGVNPHEIKMLLYTPKMDNTHEFEGVKLTSSGINWLGKFKSKEVKDFLSRSFDILLCYQSYPDKVFDKLVLNSKAHFKIGRLEGSTRIYDLAIAAAYSDIGVFTEEVKKYLRILNRLD